MGPLLSVEREESSTVLKRERLYLLLLCCLWIWSNWIIAAIKSQAWTLIIMFYFFGVTCDSTPLCVELSLFGTMQDINAISFYSHTQIHLNEGHVCKSSAWVAKCALWFRSKFLWLLIFPIVILWLIDYTWKCCRLPLLEWHTLSNFCKSSG